MPSKRRKFKSRANRFQLCSTGAPSDPLRVVRHIRLEEGLALVKAQKAEAVYEPATAVVIGFQLRACRMIPLRYEVAPIEPSDSRASCVSLSLAEMEAAAGLRGRSKTEGLSEGQRAERVKLAATYGHKARMEDLVEAARVKLQAFRPVRAGR